MYRSSAFAVTFSLVLAGCGGGGAIAPAPGFTSFGTTPNNGSYNVDGQVASRSLTSSGGSVSMGSTLVDEAVSAIVTNASGELAGLQLSSGSVAVNTGSSPTILANGNFLSVSANGGDTFILMSDPESGTYLYQVFGVGYTNVNTPGGRAYAFTLGAPTLPGDVPAGSAIYTGSINGVYVDTGGNAYLTLADMTAVTDFSTVDVSALNSAMAPLLGGTATSNSSLDFSVNGMTLANGQFSGAISGGTLVGTLNGQLYGPNGEEIGGTFSTTGSGGAYLGAFGGKR
jgi:hypothetical protein